MLALFFSFPGELGGREPPALWRFLSFTQNYELQPGTAFSHAWSLCIEEQFYLALPPVLLLASRWGRGARQAWLLMAALVLVGIASRAVLWTRYGTEAGGHIEGYCPNVYDATQCRFDELIPGVAVAFTRHFHPVAWRAIWRLPCWSRPR